MHNVSEKYINAMDAGLVHRAHVFGYVVDNNGRWFDIDDSMIIPNSLKFDKRATDGKYNLGSVYVGQLEITIILHDSSWKSKSLYDCKLHLTYEYTFEDGTKENIPLGSWIVNNVNVTKNMYKLTCYDYMCKFDTDIVENISSSNVYDVLSTISEKCGVELAHTREDVREWFNGGATITIIDKDVETYRDALSMIATITARFAYIDSDDKLRLRALGTEQVCGHISKHMRTSAEFKDYKTTIKSVVARFVDDNKYIKMKALTGHGGARLDLGDIPVIRTNKSNQQTVLNMIARAIKNVSYYECEIKMPSDPRWEVGDVVRIYKDDNYENPIDSVITHFTWTYRGEQTISCEGIDIRQSNSSNALNSYSHDSSSDIGLYAFTNSKDYDIIDKKTVIDTLFATDDPIAAMTVNFQVYVSESATVDITENVNGVDIRTFKCNASGYDNIVIHDYIQNTGTDAIHLKLDVSSTSNCRIELGDVRGTIIASAISEADGWTGRYEIDETFTPIKISSLIKMANISDTMRKEL